MKIQSTPTLRRMPTYLHRLYTLRNNGAEWVTCADLAIYMNLSHIVVRKDMAMTNLAGNRRYGFRVDDLIEAILRFIGWDQKLSATLVGAGSLGSALLGFSEFYDYNIRIESVFDCNPQKVGTKVHNFDIYDIANIGNIFQESTPDIAIICVPNTEAQKVADLLISLGVKYFWNFANVSLQVPEGVIVQREVIPGGLAVLSAKIKKHRSGEDIDEI